MFYKTSDDLTDISARDLPGFEYQGQRYFSIVNKEGKKWPYRVLLRARRPSDSQVMLYVECPAMTADTRKWVALRSDQDMEYKDVTRFQSELMAQLNEFKDKSIGTFSDMDTA